MTDALYTCEPLVKSLRRAPQGGIPAPATARRYKGGQFIPAALWNEQKQKATDALPGLLDRVGDRLQLLRATYDQNSALAREGLTRVKLVPLTTVEAQMKACVREAYDDAFILGKRAAGNLSATTAEDARAIRAIRIDEFTYLRGFLRDMRDGSGTLDYTARATYYVQATRELFWLGFALGLRGTKAKIRWVVSRQKQHCRDCLRFWRHGPWEIDDFIREVVAKGFLPCSGRLACIGVHCGCRLEQVDV